MRKAPLQSIPAQDRLIFSCGQMTSVPTVEPTLSFDTRLTPLSGGVVIQSLKLDLKRSEAYGFTAEKHPLTFSFCLKGTADIEIEYSGRPKSNLIHSPTVCTLSNIGDANGVWTPEPGCCHMVNLSIPASLAASLWRQFHTTLPAELRPQSDNAAIPEFFISQSLTPEIISAVHTLDACPIKGPGQALFQECKTLEIIILLMTQLSQSGSTTKKPIPLSRADLKRIHEARDLLETNLENPPTVTQLARQTGINEFKLKKGFRQVFGTTPYRHLREVRLETAKQYLERGEMNVCEACVAVGYSNFGNFIGLFRKKYGYTPGDLLQRSLRTTRHLMTN